MESVRMLLIEDDPEDVELLKEFLRQTEGRPYGYDLVTTDRLYDGLKLLKSARFDLVLLDLMLPDSDGFDTLFKFQEQAPQTPLIVITGHKSLGEQAKQLGATESLFKGWFKAEDLRKAIGFALLARAA